MYDKVAKLTWKKKCMNNNIEIKDSEGVIVNEPEKVSNSNGYTLNHYMIKTESLRVMICRLKRKQRL